jgi:hypothetical protein
VKHHALRSTLLGVLLAATGCGFGGGSQGTSAASTALGSTISGSTSGTTTQAPVCNKVVVETDQLTLSSAGVGQQLQASGYFTDGRVRDLSHLATWSVSDPTVATVDSQGYLWPIAAGTVSVQATYSSVNAAGTITVGAASVGATPANLLASIGALTAPDKLVVNPTVRNVVDANGTQQILVLGWWQATGVLTDVTQAATITVSDTTLASVDAFGVVTALGTGTVTITAAWQGQQATAELGLGSTAALANGDQPSVVTPPGTTVVVTTPPPLSYATAVLPILNGSCTSCHGVSQPALTPYSAAMSTAVTAGNPGASPIVQKTQPSGDMHFYLTAAQAQTISDWVQQGANP